MRNNLPMCDLLLVRGADPTLLNKAGKSPSVLTALPELKKVLQDAVDNWVNRKRDRKPSAPLPPLPARKDSADTPAAVAHSEIEPAMGSGAASPRAISVSSPATPGMAEADDSKATDKKKKRKSWRRGSSEETFAASSAGSASPSPTLSKQRSGTNFTLRNRISISAKKMKDWISKKNKDKKEGSDPSLLEKDIN